MNELFIILAALLLVVLLINRGCEETEHFAQPTYAPKATFRPVKSDVDIAKDNALIAHVQATRGKNIVVSGKDLTDQDKDNIYKSFFKIASNAVRNIGDTQLAKARAFSAVNEELKKYKI